MTSYIHTKTVYLQIVTYFSTNWAQHRTKHTFRVWRCCHSNETLALIANPPNTAQLEGISYYFPKLYRVCAVVSECGEGQTHTHRRP